MSEKLSYSPSEIPVLRAFVDNVLVTAPMLAKARDRDPEQPYAYKAGLFRLRAKLKNDGIRLINKSREGWCISPSDKPRVLAIVETSLKAQEGTHAD